MFPNSNKWPSKPKMEYQFQLNPYESFMKRHLEHYGYYTGRNEGYRESVLFRDWDKTHGYKVSDSDSDSDEDGLGNSFDANRANQEELLRSKQVEYRFQHGRLVPRLKEPRQLYALMGKELGPQQAARWPSEIEVLEENLNFIPYVPPVNEPLYKPTGYEKTPTIRSDEGSVVYEYEPQCGSFFLRSRVGGYRNGCHRATVQLTSDADDTLLFESRFESGNLQKAVKVGERDYELWLRPDLYTNKHTQWFYFRVSNTRAKTPYRLTIVNFMKPDSLYNDGMRPLMYSEQKALDKNQGWLRAGTEIKYYKTTHKYPSGKGEKSYYALTFVVEFPYDKDTCYISHCYPYTYSDLQDYIANIANDPVVSKICKQRVLCRTLAGNLVYLLTITAATEDTEKAKNKKAVVVTARVHPGETNSSWMMKGLIDYLNGNSADAKLLRDTFVFKIVPMLNPDGVIVGNYRCSLTGRDLNRNYKSVLKDAFPSVWHTKNMIKKLKDEREVIVYCDLHGHSRKQNVFIYGCENRNNPARRLRERVFPVMLSRNASDKFSYDECKFKVQKSKEGTGRIVIWNMGIMNSYTMEATFCGSTLGKKKNCHFTTVDFEKMGYHFCDTLLDYCDPDPTKVSKILSELEERLKQEILARLARQQLQNGATDLDNIDLSEDEMSALESSDGGSDSSLSDGLPVQLQYLADAKLLEAEKKKKRLKSKKERDKQRNARGSKTQETSASTTRAPSARKSRQEARPSSVVPINTLERSETRAEKRKETEYLEALTDAYIKSGDLAKNEPPKAHFRFTRKPVVTTSGGATYREPTFTAQFVARHISNQATGTGETEQYAHLRMIKRDAPLNFRNNLSPGSLQRHVEISTAQQRQQDLMNGHWNGIQTTAQSTSHIASRTTPAQTSMHMAGDYPSLGRPVNHVITSALPPDRTFNNHSVLAGISSSAPALSSCLSNAFEDEGGVNGKPIKQHPPPFDQILEKEQNSEYIKRGFSAKPSSSHSARSSRATSASSNHNRGRSHSVVDQEDYDKSLVVDGSQGREGLEQIMKRHNRYGSQPLLSDTGHMPRQRNRVTDSRRMRSVNSDISKELHNVKQLRQSLSLEKIKATCSPTTGKYIDQIVQQTDEEIAELEHDIRETQIESEFNQERKEFAVSGSNSGKPHSSSNKRTVSRQNGKISSRTPGPPDVRDYKKPGEHMSEAEIANRNSAVQRSLLQNKSSSCANKNNNAEIHQPNGDSTRTFSNEFIQTVSPNGHLLITPMVKEPPGGARVASSNSNSSQEKVAISSRREGSHRHSASSQQPRSVIGPTKVSLMIASQHGNDNDRTRHVRYKFSPLVRTNRPPLLRNPPNRRR